MNKSKNKRSLPQKTRGLTVASSPFNGVKLLFAILLVIGVLISLVSGAIWPNPVQQVIILGTYALFAMLVLMINIHRVAKASKHKAADDAANKPS